MKRGIKTELIQKIDKLLENNKLAQECITKKQQPRQLFAEAAKACLGIKELPENSGVEVELFQKTVGISVGDSWCMAFMQSCIAYVEKKTDVTSPLYGNGTCMVVWNNSPKEQRVKLLPLAGAIAVWQHTKDPAHGHTGMILDCDGVSFHAIEGNTRAGFVDINAKVGQTGDGVGFTHRRYDLFNPEIGDMQLLGCLKPF